MKPSKFWGEGPIAQRSTNLPADCLCGFLGGWLMDWTGGTRPVLSQREYIMAFYECIFLARPEISTAQVEAHTEAFSNLIIESGGEVMKT